MTPTLTPCFFSPTGTTEKIVTLLSETLASLQGWCLQEAVNLTLPGARKTSAVFSSDDFVVAGIPVYAGRVPNFILSYLQTLQGHGAQTVAVVVYGNRHYDDALAEWQEVLRSGGFQVVAGGAFIGEHSFSNELAGGRPDQRDFKQVKEFAQKIHEKLTISPEFKPVQFPGNLPPQPHYVPKNAQGQPVDIRKVTPKTRATCVGCGLCAQVCPMGSIDFQDFSKLNGICVKCGACIKRCPVQAKFFDDPGYLWHKEELEVRFQARREPEWFL